MDSAMTDPAPSNRDRAILRTVAIGTAEMIVGVEPDLMLDGRHLLAVAG